MHHADPFEVLTEEDMKRQMTDLNLIGRGMNLEIVECNDATDDRIDNNKMISNKLE